VLSVAGVALAAILAGVLLTLNAKHQRDFQNKEKAALTTLTNQLIKEFPSEKQPVQPDLIAFYPTLPDSLDKLKKGQLKTTEANKDADLVNTSATAAAQGVQGVKVRRLIPATFTATTVKGSTAEGLTQNQLLDAQSQMARSFQLYSQVGSLMKSAAAATGAQRSTLADQTNALFSQAGTLFDQGWRVVLSIRTSLGIPFSVAGLPGGTGTNG